MVYFAMFKNYRNSYLLAMHVPATLIGLKFGLVGVLPLFDSYMFSKQMIPLSVLQESESM